ncbi:MAG: hypothetical protein U0168_21605 [Nannocystaceae bacterium]
MSPRARLLHRITANLVVDAIEPCLPFWCDRLGFEQTASVPHDGALGFVILARDGVELMLQSRASVAADVPPLAGESFRSALYLEVAVLAPWRAALVEVARVVPDRRTFYGADEILVRDPAGNLVVFAQHAG